MDTNSATEDLPAGGESATQSHEELLTQVGRLRDENDAMRGALVTAWEQIALLQAELRAAAEPRPIWSGWFSQ